MAVQTERRAEVETTPSLWDAAVEVVDAGQQVMVDRVDLLRNEITHRLDSLRSELANDAQNFAVGAGLVVAAGVVALLGYALLVAAFVALLDRWLSLDASFAIAGGLHVAVGIALVATASRRFRTAGTATVGARDAPSLPGDGRG